MKYFYYLILLMITLSGCSLGSSEHSLIQQSALHPEAQEFYNQGLKYYQGKYFIQAAQSFHQAAELGHADAQYKLGRMCYDSEGVLKRDSVEAAKWYQRAAEQDHVDAQYYLGALYFVGSGLPQDYVQAQKWYQRAAEHGQVDAQLSLGMMYYKGIGIEQDLALAKKWLSAAAELGSQEAVVARDEVNIKLAQQEE